MSDLCKVVRSRRRTAAFTVTKDGEILLRVPLWVSDQEAHRLISENQTAIRSLRLRWERAMAQRPIYRDEEIPRLKLLAAERLPNLVNYWSAKMGLSPKSVKITSAKTRFGSCSSRGSICFSCFLMLYPNDAIEYVIVHELAHLKHLNHSAAFYRLVEHYLPDYQRRAAILKGNTH